jgi:hypothetical protein
MGDSLERARAIDGTTVVRAGVVAAQTHEAGKRRSPRNGAHVRGAAWKSRRGAEPRASMRLQVSIPRHREDRGPAAAHA